MLSHYLIIFTIFFSSFSFQKGIPYLNQMKKKKLWTLMNLILISIILIIVLIVIKALTTALNTTVSITILIIIIWIKLLIILIFFLITFKSQRVISLILLAPFQAHASHNQELMTSCSFITLSYYLFKSIITNFSNVLYEKIIYSLNWIAFK